MDLKKALQTALDFEKKGQHIYEEVAKKTKNPIVSKTFSYLAKQEINHIDEIKKYMEKNEIELKGDKPQDTKKFFTTTIFEFKEKTELSDNDTKAHEAALDLEKKSYDFYKGQFEKSGNNEMKNFFSFLMKQENAHYELINKSYEFIKNPEDFYGEQERWMFEG